MAAATAVATAAATVTAVTEPGRSAPSSFPRIAGRLRSHRDRGRSCLAHRRCGAKLTPRAITPFAAVVWQEPGNVIGMEQRGWLSVRIDKATKDVVEGRVFAWFEDASKSMIVGAFTAKQCNLKP